MTATYGASPLAATSVEAALVALRHRGLRASTARRMVLEALFAAERPVSAEQVAGGLDGRFPPSDLASVYRNLEMLERLGLVRHFHLGHGPGLYAPAVYGDREYLVCDRCGDVRAVEAAKLDGIRASIREGFGYEARFTHFPIVGLCAACTAAPEGSSPG